MRCHFHSCGGYYLRCFQSYEDDTYVTSSRMRSMPAITTTNTEYATTRCRCNGIGSSIGSSTVVAADVSISYSNNYNDYYYMVGSISSDGVSGVVKRSVATLLLLQHQQHTTINRGG